MHIVEVLFNHVHSPQPMDSNQYKKNKCLLTCYAKVIAGEVGKQWRRTLYRERYKIGGSNPSKRNGTGCGGGVLDPGEAEPDVNRSKRLGKPTAS
jgi:hypothetical protein